MSDIPEQIDFIDEMPEYDLAMYTNKKMKTTAETAKEALEAILPVLEAIPADGFTRDAVHAALFALIEEKGVKTASCCGLCVWRCPASSSPPAAASSWPLCWARKKRSPVSKPPSSACKGYLPVTSAKRR